MVARILNMFAECFVLHYAIVMWYVIVGVALDLRRDLRSSDELG